jgi:alkyl hydroperoxide reductase subunit AhpC
MSTLVTQTAEMLSLLPEEEISLVNELVKKLVVAWDADFTKVTPEEEKSIKQAEEEMRQGIYLTEEEVWN